MRTKKTTRQTGDKFGDRRLEIRYKALTERLSDNLAQSIPQSGHTWGETKAAYRFFDNPSVSPSKMLKLHNEGLEHLWTPLSESESSKDKSASVASPSSLKGERRRLLQLTDTVELDYTGKKGASALGPLNYKKRLGMHAHNSLIINELGAPLTLMSQTFTIRDTAGFGDSEKRTALPFEEKETYRWRVHFEQAQELCKNDPLLEMVYIADTESDMIEVFQARVVPNMHFVIRSKFNRLLVGKQERLYEYLAKQPSLGQYAIPVLDAHTGKKRLAILAIRFAKVEITQNRKVRSKPDKSIVPLYAVQAIEMNPPPAIEPVNWVLLTTLPVENFEQALLIMRYYALRWIIERFHFLMKSGGAHVEELQLQTAHRLKNAVTIYSIAAMEALKIRYWAENEPQTPIYEAGVTPVEYEVLYTYAHSFISHKIIFKKNEPPNIEQYAKVLGQIAGFKPSKRQPLPGLKCLSRATEKLKTLVDAYLIFCQ